MQSCVLSIRPPGLRITDLDPAKTSETMAEAHLKRFAIRTVSHMTGSMRRVNHNGSG